MADWDSMSRVITQTYGQAFQTLSQVFSFLLSSLNSIIIQMSDKCDSRDRQ